MGLCCWINFLSYSGFLSFFASLGASGWIQVILVLYGIYLSIKYLFEQHKKNERYKKQLKWNEAGKDVVVLHQFQRGRFCPNPSPFPIKLETFLRINKIKYVNDFEEPKSDKSKSPWITINGENIADSQLAIKYLTKKFDLEINKGMCYHYNDTQLHIRTSI